MAKTYDPIKTPEYADLLKNIKERITETQYEALKSVNKELIALYWDIGRMIVERQDKESWGKSVVELLSKDLQAEFPGIRGFSMQNLWYRPTPTHTRSTPNLMNK